MKILLALFTLMGFSGYGQQLFEMPKDVQSRVSSFENLNGLKGNGGKDNQGAKGHAFEPIRAGETKTLLDIKEAGIICRIWCTVFDRSPKMLRSLRLKMFWDGAAKPAVDVPLGDFFGAGLGVATTFQSALFVDPEGRSFQCFIQMPFKKSARITLTNESNSNLMMLFFDIDFTLAPPPTGMLYFHACWNRAKTSMPGKDFELVPTIKGKGRFLGVNIGVNVDSAYGGTWWGEGEVKMYLDGDDKNPTINGTGAEDYAGAGWGLGKFANLYDGCTVSDEKTGQYAFYRFHIPDPVYFQQSFRATIQEIGGGMDAAVKALIAAGVPAIPVTVADVSGGLGFTGLRDGGMKLSDPNFPSGWMNFYRVDDYSATAYFYFDSPTDDLKELAPVSERIN
jgi:hypothetical protein